MAAHVRPPPSSLLIGLVWSTTDKEIFMKISKSLLTIGFALGCMALTFSLAVCAQAQTVTDLANFNSRNGLDPFRPLVQGTDGNFYGSTFVGGAYKSGNIFRVTPSGEIKSIYSFCGHVTCPDGKIPVAPPIVGSDGNLYGVASSGGSFVGSEFGSGTVYKLTLSGHFTILHTFCTAFPCTDGQGPNGLVLGSDGHFYGTTYRGGQLNGGAFFQISSTGAFQVLHSFCNAAYCAGGLPVYPPIQASNGDFYGTTQGGGATGAGTVYQLTPAGVYTVLHSFCYGAGCDGQQPTTIVEDGKGNLFGTTVSGGSNGYGTVYEITSSGQYIVLDSFDFLRGYPFGGLALANDGDFYGTTEGAQERDSTGTLFKITPAGAYTQLYTFGECNVSGYAPNGVLFQATNGILYGTTTYGGNGTDNGCGGYGTVFSLSSGLSPLVKTVPVAGKVGTQVIILGNNLTGSTSVTFNGVPAEFTVQSDTYIQATVPGNATTGTVSVITPSGTLDSNPQFVVIR
jgi:uncharacterized repeat protein (TIGR03803 family)